MCVCRDSRITTIVRVVTVRMIVGDYVYLKSSKSNIVPIREFKTSISKLVHLPFDNDVILPNHVT